MRTRTELTLDNAFSDPLVRSLMAADKVDAAGLQTMLAGIARQIAPSISPATLNGFCREYRWGVFLHHHCRAVFGPRRTPPGAVLFGGRVAPRRR
jgi:hypothetical protein